jgi:hypothetical protein
VDIPSIIVYYSYLLLLSVTTADVAVVDMQSDRIAGINLLYIPIFGRFADSGLAEKNV